MVNLLLLILGAATLAAPFGEAAASAVDEGTYMAVTVEVTVDPAYRPDYVVVHLLNPDGQETFALGAGPDGRFVGEFTILPFNRAVLFEAGREGEFVQSRTVSLLDLGIEPDLLQTTYRPPDQQPDRNRWGWLALAAGALAATALLGWYLLPKTPATVRVGRDPDAPPG